MKKLFWFLAGFICIFGIWAFINALYSNNCQDIYFDNWDRVCVEIAKSWTRYYVSAPDYSLDKSQRSAVSLMCELTLPNGDYLTFPSCQGEFTCNSNTCYGRQNISLYARLDNRYWWWFDSINYDFANWSRNNNWWNNNGNSNNNYLNISSNNTYTSINSYVSLYVETSSSYRGRINFEMQYKPYNSSSWQTVNSSSYFSADSYFNNWYYFTSSDNGYHAFNSSISFAKDWYYRVYIRDDNGNSKYQEFTVWSDSSSNNNSLYISTSNSSPSTNQYIDVTVETNSNYRWRVNFYLEYRSSSSSSRSSVSSSSSDITPDSYFRNWYQFTSSDNGYKKFYSMLKFNRSGQYRLTVSDNNYNEKNITFYIDTNWNTTNNQLSLSSNNLYPTTNQYINLTINTNSNYRWRTTFYVQYRSNTSNSRYTVSNSDYYVADYRFIDWYQFNSYDNGYHNFTDAIMFKQNWYYKIYARDDSWNESSIQINVNTNDSNNNSNLKISSSTLYPNLDQYINVYVEANSNYRWRINFYVQYRSSTSSSRQNISSSNYFTPSSDFNYWYQFGSYDNGYRNFNNFIKFHREWYYRLYVKDSQWNENYIQINPNYGNSSSNINWFSSSELRKLTAVSNIRDSVISKLKNSSSYLRNDSYRQRLSDTMQTNMRDVINNYNYRTYNNYSDFYRAFNDWMTYTVRNS